MEAFVQAAIILVFFVAIPAIFGAGAAALLDGGGHRPPTSRVPRGSEGARARRSSLAAAG